MSLRGDIDRIKSAVGQERWPPAAIAIFARSGRGLYTEVPLPENVPDRVIVDATPCARPMLAVLAVLAVLAWPWSTGPPGGSTSSTRTR